MWSRAPGAVVLAWVLPSLGAAATSACESSTEDPAPPTHDSQAPLDAGQSGDELDAAFDAAPTTQDSMRDAGPDLLQDAELDARFDAADLSNDGAAPTPVDGGPPIMCSVQAPTACPEPAPHYGDVEPIFQARCVICHNPTWSGPWPLDSYRHVTDWQDTIRSNLLDCTMPPPEAGVPMSNEERLAILTWIRCGFPM